MNKICLIAIMALGFLSGCHNPAKENLKIMEINEGWNYRQVNGTYSGKATVPGVIHTDLLNNAQIEDPFYRTNEKDLQWIDKEDWEYETVFSADDALMAKDRIQLYFLGLDTYADVYLNDSLVLEADNMHRTWKVDVKNFLRGGANTLRVYFHSPIKRGLELYEASPYAYPATNDQSENGGLGDKKVSVFTRKAGYHYGWDWGPRFVTSGIWRPVSLMAWDELNVETLYVRQTEVSLERASLTADALIDVENAVKARVELYNRTDERLMAQQEVQLQKGSNKLELPFVVEQPKLWWSHGLGDPHCYDFELWVKVDGQQLASKRVTTGLRSVKLVREKDEQGESFLFELNGVRVFAKGANYIPNDSFLPRVSKAAYEKVVADAVDANMNMLRIWGGGVYEDDYFYELCDKNGIMVWEDFMFACSMYPGDDAFLANVKAEAEDNVKRLRNHPSIVLWCGNNEINTAWNGWGWKAWYTEQQQVEIQKAYTDVFHRVLPQVVDSLTENMDYWPSSPQAGYEYDQHASYETTSGDMHYWGVWHGLHPFEDFDRYKSRFMSEYGFQSFPDLETVQRYTQPQDYNIESEVMAAHQRSGIGNLRIREYLSWYYEVPDSFEQFLYMSQILQAHSIRMAIEAHRRAMPYCMGSLYWQINDCWPVASWSSTDYYHKWKAVHYAVKKAFEPVMISTVNDGDEVRLVVVSDLLEDQKGMMEIKIMDFEGKLLFENSDSVLIHQNSSTELNAFRLMEAGNWDKSAVLMTLSLSSEGRTLADKIHYFEKSKGLNLPKAKLDIQLDDSSSPEYVKIHADGLIRGLYLYDTRGGLVLEDNYFDLLPGAARKIRIKEFKHMPVSENIKYRFVGME